MIEKKVKTGKKTEPTKKELSNWQFREGISQDSKNSYTGLFLMLTIPNLKFPLEISERVLEYEEYFRKYKIESWGEENVKKLIKATDKTKIGEFDKKVKEINVILVKGQLNKDDVDNLIKLMNDLSDIVNRRLDTHQSDDQGGIIY